MKKVFILTLLIAGFAVSGAKAQKLAVKSNALYDITSTINIGAEIVIKPQWTIEVPFNYNPWKFSNGLRLQHFGIQPEARYWFCQPFRRLFVGAHLHYAAFNVGDFPNSSLFSENMQDSRYEGSLFGGGFSVGYSWIIKRQWGIETTLGLGYARINYDKYPCGDCGTKIKDTGRNYWGPTRAGVSFIYLLK